MNPSFEFDVVYTQKDFLALVRFNAKKQVRQSPWIGWGFLLFLVGIPAFGLWTAQGPIHFNGFVSGFLMTVVTWTALQMISAMRLSPHPSGAFLRPHRIRIDEQGIHTSTSLSDQFLAWTAVLDWAVTKHHVFLADDNYSAVVIPRDCLADSFRQIEFLQFVQLNAGAPTGKSPLD